MTAQTATRALCAVRDLLEKLREKALSVFSDLRECGLVALREQATFRGCGLAPRAEEYERGFVGHRLLARGICAQDRVAQLIARGSHDEVEHRIELSEVNLHGRRFHAGSAGDSGCGERSRGDSRVATQHLRSIRFNLIDLAHFDRMTDPPRRCAPSAFAVSASELAPSVCDKSAGPRRTEQVA